MLSVIYRRQIYQIKAKVKNQRWKAIITKQTNTTNTSL